MLELIDPAIIKEVVLCGNSTFLYREMPGDVEADIRSKAVKVKVKKRGSQEINAKDYEVSLLKWGLKGWKNVGRAGEEIAFREDYIPYLPGDVRETLVDLILRADDNLTESEEKKIDVVPEGSGEDGAVPDTDVQPV